MYWTGSKLINEMINFIFFSNVLGLACRSSVAIYLINLLLFLFGIF